MDYVEEVRATLQDYPELNHILLERSSGEEHTDQEIGRYLKKSLARINAKPPITHYNLENFPESPWWILLIDGALIEALKSKGILKIRNEMPYQDQGGTSVRLEGKGQQYLQTATTLYRGWREMLSDFKKGLSVERGWGGVSTEYRHSRW